MDEKLPKYTLRETVDNLGEAFPLQSDYISEINHYWRCGYMVQHGALTLARIETANIASTKQYFRKSGLGNYVFFDNPFDPADLEHNSRQQIMTNEYGKLNKDFLNTK